MSDGTSELLEQTFTVKEGILYRVLRGTSILLNKMFFGALSLLVLWVILSAITGDAGCAPSFEVVETENGTIDQPTQQCSVLLNPTSLYLGSMAILTYILSIILGLLGLAIGKQIVATNRDDEVGAGMRPLNQNGNGGQGAEEPAAPSQESEEGSR